MKELVGLLNVKKGDPMYQKILVSLDGSELDEGVLAHVDALGRGCLVKEIIFVRAVEPFESPSIVADYPIKPEEVIRINAENWTAAENYINKIVSGLRYEGVRIHAELLDGRAAEILPDYASRNEVDLIVMATHGSSRVGRWVWRSLADRILRSACVPVVMVPEPVCLLGI